MRADKNSGKMGIRVNAETDELLLEFDSTDEEFQRGFECGEIWACLTDEVEEVHSIISASNAEMVMRMAEAAQYSYKARYLEQSEVKKLDIGPGEWMIVVLRGNHG